MESAIINMGEDMGVENIHREDEKPGEITEW